MRGKTRSAKQGIAPRHAMKNAKPKRGKRKKSKINQLGLVALIAFVFLTPDAKQFVLAKWAEVEGWLEEGMAPVQKFPLETEYTVLRSIDLWNNGTDIGHLEETIPLPSDVTSKESDGVDLAFNDDTEVNKRTIQEIKSIELRIDNEKIQIPLSGQLERSNAKVTSQGNLVWWPAQGQGEDKCDHGPCVRVSIDVPANSHESVDMAVTLKSTSHTWWHSTRIDGKLEGKSEGTSLSRSGTFDDISDRGAGQRDVFASSMNWYNRNGDQLIANWAIDARQSNAPMIHQTASSIEASLPSNLKNNVYAYARATFDWLNDNIPYDTAAPNTARSGEQCLDIGRGDCDEQSNAFMSIMRYKGVPTWYVFGALTDSTYSSWQGHAWAYIMLPMSDEWCEENDVKLESCYVEGSVDVVNRKWLVHTPTAYIDWIEEDPWQLVDAYYKGKPFTGDDTKRVRSFSTEGYETSGGTWDHKWLSEDLS